MAAPPILAGGGLNLTVAAGLTFTQTVLTFTATDSSATAGNFSATIAWGDGSTSTGSAVTILADPDGGFDVEGGHVYSTNGSYVVSVTIGDSTGDIASARSAVNVVTASITATPSNISAVMVAGVDDIVATFASTDPSAQTSDFTATITWDNSGNSSATTTGTILDDGSGTFSVQGNYTYANNGSFPVTVTINGPGSTSVQISETATVSDISVSGNNLTLDKGLAFSDTVANFQTSLTATLTASINWDDGTTTTGTITVAVTASEASMSRGNHSYTTAGTYALIVTVSTPATPMKTASDTGANTGGRRANQRHGLNHCALFLQPVLHGRHRSSRRFTPRFCVRSLVWCSLSSLVLPGMTGSHRRQTSDATAC